MDLLQGPVIGRQMVTCQKLLGQIFSYGCAVREDLRYQFCHSLIGQTLGQAVDRLGLLHQSLILLWAKDLGLMHRESTGTHLQLSIEYESISDRQLASDVGHAKPDQIDALIPKEGCCKRNIHSPALLYLGRTLQASEYCTVAVLL